MLYGQTERGKTHLTIALGVKRVQAGKVVRFFTAAGLAMALERTKRDDLPEAFLKDVGKSELLIVDDLGLPPVPGRSEAAVPGNERLL